MCPERARGMAAWFDASVVYCGSAPALACAGNDANFVAAVSASAVTDVLFAVAIVVPLVLAVAGAAAAVLRPLHAVSGVVRDAPGRLGTVAGAILLVSGLAPPDFLLQLHQLTHLIRRCGTLGNHDVALLVLCRARVRCNCQW